MVFQGVYGAIEGLHLYFLTNVHHVFNKYFYLIGYLYKINLYISAIL